MQMLFSLLTYFAHYMSIYIHIFTYSLISLLFLFVVAEQLWKWINSINFERICTMNKAALFMKYEQTKRVRYALLQLFCIHIS